MNSQQKLKAPHQAIDNRVSPYTLTEASPADKLTTRLENSSAKQQEDGLSFYQKLKLTKSQKSLKIDPLILCNSSAQGINQISHPRTT